MNAKDKKQQDQRDPEDMPEPTCAGSILESARRRGLVLR